MKAGVDTTVVISGPDETGGSSCQIYTRAPTLAEAMAAATHAFEGVLGNRKALVRVAPRAEVFRDFAADTAEFRGRARFWFWDVPGERSVCADDNERIRFVPFGTLKPTVAA